MAMKPGSRTAILLACVGVLVATRIPAESVAEAALAVSFGAVAAAAALFGVRPGVPAWVRVLAYLSCLALLLVPDSPTAWLTLLPPWIVALAFVVALSVFFQDAAADAPVVGTRHEAARSARRFLPFAVGVLTLTAIPLLYPWVLPLRVRAAYELQGVLGPLVPLVFLTAIIVSVGVLRSRTGRGRNPQTSRPPDDAKNPAEVNA